MTKLISLGVILLSASFSIFATESMVKYESPYSVTETANRFEEIIKSKGLTLFARIDHQQNAANIKMALRPTEVIIFGSAKVGTPLMLCAQNVGIDLPQKVLITEDINNKVWLSYNNPNYLKERHDIKGCDPVIEKISGVLGDLAKASVAKK